jgi:hypothetical protein
MDFIIMVRPTNPPPGGSNSDTMTPPFHSHILTYLQTLKCLSFHHDCTRISPDFFRIEHETVSFITSDKGEGEYRTRVVLLI